MVVSECTVCATMVLCVDNANRTSESVSLMTSGLFGRPNASTGYMHVGSEVVHRIVATAFYDDQPSEKHIIDHIDTNRRNSRVENLRWITRLDNLLLNPITRQRIISAYGSMDEFFKNPGAATKPGSVRNFGWMRTVSKEEAQASRNRLLKWADSGQIPKGGRLGEWVYGTRQLNEPIFRGDTRQTVANADGNSAKLEDA